MTTNIEDKLLITGASSEIGEATARLLAQEGAEVVFGLRRASCAIAYAITQPADADVNEIIVPLVTR